MNPRLRQALGPAYPHLLRLKCSRPLVLARSVPGALPYALARIRRQPLWVDLPNPVGMGALISHALLLHAHFARTGKAGHVSATGPLYSARGEDVFAAFFSRPPPPAAAPLGPLAAEFLINLRRAPHLPLAEAQALLARHFQPNARLAQAIDAACGPHPFDATIHFRGTDKVLESGAVAHAPMLAAIRRELPGHAEPRLFLATDDPAFAAALRAEWPLAAITSYDLGAVPPGTPRHFSALSPADKALEALVNIHALARAPVCIRTSSYLSAISALVAPAMRTVTVNRTIGRAAPFPEAELLAREQAAAQ